MSGRTSRWSFCVVMAQCVLFSLPALGAPQALRVEQARLTNNLEQSGDRGRILIKGTVDDLGTGIDLLAALGAGEVIFRVSDGRSFAADVPLTSCTPAGSGVRCNSAQARARIRRVRSEPYYRFRLSVRHLDGAATGTVQPLSPVSVTVQVQGHADLIDVISDCDPAGRAALSCRDEDRPNIIFIVTDDQRSDSLQYMPRLLERVAAGGITFTNAFVTTRCARPVGPAC